MSNENKFPLKIKVIDTPYFFGQNRDLGTISVYIGYCYARCVSPLHVNIWKNEISR
jgi:hypothetical protein